MSIYLSKITALSHADCKTAFRFTYDELILVARALGLPRRVTFRQGTRQQFSLERVVALAVMLKRLAYPGRLIEVKFFFGMHETTVGNVFNDMIDLLYYHYHEGIRFNKEHLNDFNLIKFSDAIIEKGKQYTQIIYMTKLGRFCYSY